MPEGRQMIVASGSSSFLFRLGMQRVCVVTPRAGGELELMLRQRGKMMSHLANCLGTQDVAYTKTRQEALN